MSERGCDKHSLIHCTRCAEEEAKQRMRDRIAQLEAEVERLRKYADLFVECRSSLVFDMNNYGRVLAEMERAGQQTSPAYSAVERDRARLHGLIEAIDAALAAKGG